MKSVEKLISRFTIALGGLVLLLMIAQIVIDIAMRTIFGAGFPSTAEIVSKYYMVAVSFVPIAYAEIERRHVEATFFTDFIALKKRQFFTLFGLILSVLVYALMSWGTLLEAISQTEKKAYIETGVHLFYTWPSYWILPIFLGLMLVMCILRIFTYMIHIFKGQVYDADKGHGVIELDTDGKGE